MKVKVMPGKFRGTVQGISSKSHFHRILICAAGCKETTDVFYNGMGDDVQATIECLKQLGMRTEPIENGVRIYPIPEGFHADGCVLNCKESGSTLRFLLPVAAAMTEDIRFTGEGRLGERPLKELLICLKKAGKNVEGERLPVCVTGKLQSREFEIPANISSQYITGLLLMGSMLNENIIIKATTGLKSAPYIAMTMEVMEKFGVKVERKETEFLVEGQQGYRSPGKIQVEGDWSNASFFLVANAMGQQVEVPNLCDPSSQGDSIVSSLIREIRDSKQCCINLSDVPDLAAPLAVLAAVTPGETVFEKGECLRLKESDRIESIVSMISNLGGNIRETKDGFIIEGKGILGGEVNSFGDHRIAMAATIASCCCKEPVIIENPMVVNKSYPYFYEEIQRIGGVLEWTN